MCFQIINNIAVFLLYLKFTKVAERINGILISIKVENLEKVR